MRGMFRGLGRRSRWRAATAAVAGLALTGLVVGVAAVPANAATPSWAGSAFCSSHDGGKYLGSSYNGVAACSGPLSGTVEYSSSVIFDTAGYNCVELAARYLYATTTINPPEVPSAYKVASAYASAAKKLNYNFPLSGWTSAYSTSIAPGDIISMQGPGNSNGHVAVVTGVSVSGGQGEIHLLDENDPKSPNAVINVSGGKMTFDNGYYTSFQWVALDTAIPAEPQSLSASSVTGSSAVLHWTDSANNVGQYLTQYKVGNGAWQAGPSAPAGATSVSVGGLKTGTTYTFQVGASNAKGTRWSAYLTVKTASAPTPAPAPTGYNTGRKVTVVSQATGGDSGHRGPANSYPAGPTHAAGSPIYIVCYVNGQSIAGPYGTETAWDLGDDGYYYSDAWLWTNSNSPVVPACALKTVTVVSQATGGDSGHTGPSNAYSAGPTRAARSSVQIACYVNGQSIAGPYGTESIWDLSTDGYYYSDAWLWTDSNGPVVPQCP